MVCTFDCLILRLHGAIRSDHLTGADRARRPPVIHVPTESHYEYDDHSLRASTDWRQSEKATSPGAVGEKRTLTGGAGADLAIVEGDPAECPADNLIDNLVPLTLVVDEIVHRVI
jgi:hypothetical protein